MSLVFSAEHDELRSAVRSFFADRIPTSETRRLIAEGEFVDRATWLRMAQELGLQGLGIPEEYGGLGYGAVERAVVFEEAGRGMVGAPLLGTVALAATAILAAGDPVAAKDLLPGIADGTTMAAVAFTEDHGSWDIANTALRAEYVGDRYEVTGHKNYVLDGASADVLLVVARIGDRLSLFAVDTEAEGVRRSSLSTLDVTRSQIRVTFTATGARLVGALGAAPAIMSHTLNIASTFMSVEQVGGAQHCLDMTVDYAKTRAQFGRLIGSFQAVKHRCADMLVAVESARSAANEAVWAATSAPAELPIAAAMAKAVASSAFQFCAASAIQLHGGIGFTWDHDAHLYYRRAQADALLFGDVNYQRELVACALAI